MIPRQRTLLFVLSEVPKYEKVYSYFFLYKNVPDLNLASLSIVHHVVASEDHMFVNNHDLFIIFLQFLVLVPLSFSFRLPSGNDSYEYFDVSLLL